MSKKKKNFALIIISLFLFLLFGISYAYIKDANVFGNSNSDIIDIDSNHIASGEITVSYDGSDGILDVSGLSLNNSIAGESVEDLMKLTITNNVAYEHYVTIKWKNVVNNFCQYRDASYTCTNNVNHVFVGDEVSYNLYECTQENYNNATVSNLETNCVNLSGENGRVMPVTDVIESLHDSSHLTIPGNSTKYYVVKAGIKNLLTPQDYQANGSLSAEMDVQFYYGWDGVLCATNPNLLNCRIVTAYSPIPDNKKSQNVLNESGIDFSINSSNINGQGLYEAIKIDNTGFNKYFRGNVTGNYVKFGKYAFDVAVYVPATGNPIYYASLSSCETAYGVGNCLDYISKNDDILWRILRINEDGSIRLITDKAPFGSSFNSTVDIEMVGYTMNRTSNSIGTDSIIKTAIDTWYLQVLSNYENKLVKQEYCNDTTTTGSGTMLKFATRNRLYDANSPTFNCPLTDKNYGGKYNLYVGTVTADELTYAGAVVTNSTTLNYFLETGFNFWTSSPLYDNDTNSYLSYYRSFSTGKNIINSVPNVILGVRPVVNLKAETLVTGSGTLLDPWVVQ